MIPSIRSTFLLMFFGCVGLILIALYFQYGMDMHPCPLCITQRIFVIAAGLVALLAALHNPARLGRCLYSLLGIVCAAVGGAVALRHVWLQSLPEDQVPACGPGLGYMLENFPLQQALSLLLQGDGNCADVSWSLLGLSMPAWVAVCFAGLIGIYAWQMLRK
ncbi:MAG: disulfide bond formation protein B [Gammaproteobacteria bacterium]|uniref:disulfide bond formation protein B n=1 Tax=Pseudomaricurvus alcaniphilus TaxID=1166482 RepID=UPI00140D9AC6|nr:disulfide bond formation protein B [Pseudomaricurvus alcaniphilus]MBR9912180.1 disulfide bond formation protein B [Gammaproteobacteria bacterium]NHN38755.1 disulfide bond formation protein B [Pseudomaricurvus alcaniphilus]